MSTRRLPPYTGTAIVVAVVLYFGLQRDGGVAVAFFAPILVGCAIYALVRLLWKKPERRTRAIQLAAWVGTLVLVAAVQAAWSSAARERADAAASAVLAHRQKTGGWPESLAHAGLDEASLRGEWRMRYRVQDGKARLAYPHQTLMLSSHEYDFDAKRWTLDAY